VPKSYIFNSGVDLDRSFFNSALVQGDQVAIFTGVINVVPLDHAAVPGRLLDLGQLVAPDGDGAGYMLVGEGNTISL
jgi:hypothetical protein